MQRPPRHRCRGKGGQEGISGRGPDGGVSNRQRRGRTARRTDPWLWQERVRAEENRGERSPRRAGQAIWGVVPCNRRAQRSLAAVAEPEAWAGAGTAGPVARVREFAPAKRQAAAAE